MQPIDQFVEKLIQEKGIKETDQQILAEIKKDLTKRVEDRIKAVIVKNLPESKLSEFESKLDAPDAEMQEFIAKAIPNLKEVIALELLRFRNTYLNISA